MNRNSILLTGVLVAALGLILYITTSPGGPRLTTPERANSDAQAEESANAEQETAAPAQPSDESAELESGAGNAASSSEIFNANNAGELNTEDRPGEESFGLKFLGTLLVTDGGRKIERQFLFTHKPELGIIPVYFKRSRYDGETEFKVHRLYPDTYSKEEIRADIVGEGPIETNWLDSVPDPETYTEESFLTEDIAETSDFIVLEEGCKRYMGGSGCAIGVLANSFGLTPGRLEQDTGPYEWSRISTLSEVRVLPDGKLFLKWGFGDGGARAVDHSIWDTTKGTHSFVSGYGGMLGESMSVSVPRDAEDMTYSILGYDVNETSHRMDVFDEDMFGELPGALYQEPPEYCIEVKPIPKDRSDPEATWLLEYSYGCNKIGYDLAFRYYELDPVAGTSTPLTDVLFK